MSKANLEFQVIDINTYHEIDDEDEQNYVIQFFGRTEDDKDVSLKITGFTPHFYIYIPQRWGDKEVEILVSALKKKVSWKTTNDPKCDYDLGNSLIRYNIVQRHKFYGFTNKKLFKFVRLVFKSQTGMRAFSNMLCRPLKITALSDQEILYERYESNIEPHIRFLHINELSSCGWITIDKKHLNENKKYSNCDLSYQVFWKHVKPAENDNRIAPLKIMAYDIECISCDHNFPQANRKSDKIIQIGVTMYRYGSMQCYDKHILILGPCSPIADATVECYETEKDLLKGFAKKISQLRPDIKAGYNNKGFDDKYIYDRIYWMDERRAKKLGIEHKDLPDKLITEVFDLMGKVNNKYLIEKEGIGQSLTTFEEKNLSSAALGDNCLRFFNVPGILTIDMMKVIQKDHKLTGYKLDNVAATFITEKIKKVIEGKSSGDDVAIQIYTDNTKALDVNAYIQIMINDGYSLTPLREGSKYKVNDICSTSDKQGRIIKTSVHVSDLRDLQDALNNPLLTLCWTFAKDDMHHRKINKYFNEGNPKKIRQIANYCLKDCMLVNLLIAKLEIIINTVSMAKVCVVPLSYLFLRGQGVKIFSLVSKECRKKNYLIPVLTKKENGDDDETYEGATVIVPIPGVYLTPTAVLDYNSLYPQSIRERNMSHETYVNDPKYDNLPGYIYRDVVIDKKDGNGNLIMCNGVPVRVRHRFAEEKNDTGVRKFGVLAGVITTLLDNRAIINKKLETEENPELKAAYKGLQLAYKITANSLYGQTGAPTSPIFLQAIAACTATIGRERLHFAKSIVEDNFKGSKIVYGDSVTGDTPLVVKQNDQIIITTIEKLSENWTSYDEFKMFDTNRTDKQQSLTDSQIWTANGWAPIRRVIRHKTVKKIYRVLTHTGCIDVTEDHSLLSANREIIKPGDCKVGMELLHGFMNDFGEPESFPGRDYVAEDKLEAQHAYYFFRSLGYDATVDNDIYIPYYYKIKCCKKIENPNVIKRITYLGMSNDYVYDLETESGTFQAGIGQMIVKNTDSIFIVFGLKNPDGSDRTDADAVTETIALGKRAAALINSLVPNPQRIVYEKIYAPLILIAKKKYVGPLYVNDNVNYKVNAMGIVLKRRDNAPIVKIVVGGIIDQIIKTRDIEAAIENTKIVISNMMNQKYPIDKFIISKTLKSNYKNPRSIAHKVLADRMAHRDPGNAPQVNDRIQFVYVHQDLKAKNKKDILQGDLIETPEYVISNKLQIDYLYYLEHQIINPASQILELMMPKKKVAKFFNKYIIDEWNKRRHCQSMEKWFDASATKGLDNWEPMFE